MITISDIICPCCNGHDVRWLGKLPDNQWFAGSRLEQVLPGGSLYRCLTCNLKFRHPVQQPATYRRLYDNPTITTWPSDTDRPDWDLIKSHIEKHIPHRGRVLDFGCYSGGLLLQLRPDLERYGVEVNHAAAEVASINANALVWQSLSDIPRDIRFDAVILSDVIEHLPNPLKLIAQLSSRLKNQGVLLITTGDANNYLWNRFGANWWYCFYPEHIVFLSKDCVHFISQATGLTLVRSDNFRYHVASWGARLVDAVLVYFYGWFPSLYILIAGMLRRVMGRPNLTSIPGNGVSADHLFLVLRRTS